MFVIHTTGLFLQVYVHVPLVICNVSILLVMDFSAVGCPYSDINMEKENIVPDRLGPTKVEVDPLSSPHGSIKPPMAPVSTIKYVPAQFLFRQLCQLCVVSICVQDAKGLKPATL